VFESQGVVKMKGEIEIVMFIDNQRPSIILLIFTVGISECWAPS